MTADLHHLAAAYALNALDENERRAFEAHYPSCEICSGEVADFREAAAALAATTESPPPASLKSKVLTEISQTRQLSPVSPSNTREQQRPNWWSGRTMLAAAAAVLLLVALVAVVRSPTDADTNELVEPAQVIDSSDALVTNLVPTSDSEPATLQIVWSDERDQVAVVGSQVGDPGVDQAYALWFVLTDGGVAPAGLFLPEGGSVNAVLAVEDREDITGWGVSIEPSQGSPQPTTPVLFAGTL